MRHEVHKQQTDSLIESSQIDTLTPSELLDYCYNLDIKSEQYIDLLMHALNVGIHAYIQTSSQIRVGQFPDYKLWNVSHNYYSVVEQIQDLIQLHMSRIRSEI